MVNEGERFVVLAAGLEKERIDRILGIAIDQGKVEDFESEPFGGYDDKESRYRYEILAKGKAEATDIRRRIGCSYAGIGPGVYFKVDDYGHDWSKM